MNKRMISIMLGVLALAALAGGAVLLSRAQGALPRQEEALAQPVSPLRTPAERATVLPSEISPISTPTPEEALPQPVLEVQPVPRDILLGEKIAFLRDQNLWIVNVATRILAQVTLSGNVTRIYGWSHDGSQLLLGVGERPVPPETDVPGGSNLWVMSADGTKLLQLTENLEVMDATWSPIDSRIAYGTRDAKIHLVNSDGTAYRVLLADDDNVSYCYLGTWSPDGSRITYREWIPSPDAVHVMVLDLAGGSRHQLTSEGSAFVGYLYSFDVQWSLDGRRILFQSPRDPGASVWWVVDADGSNLIHLDNETLRSILSYSQWAPRSPIADQVVFSTYDSFYNEIIWVMDFGGQAREVARGSFPVWLPRGDRIAYVGEDGGLWIVNLDGTGAAKLSDTDGYPWWSR
jgi:Tol biopolymer transport system component